MSNKTLRLFGVVIIVVALVSMEPGRARAQSQNYNAARSTIGATAAMYGAGAVLCTALTAGGCGIGLAIGGVVLGGTAATLSMFPPPNDTTNWRDGSASAMPDYDEDYGYLNYAGDSLDNNKMWDPSLPW